MFVIKLQFLLQFNIHYPIMRYRLEIILNKPVEKVIETFTHASQKKHWHRDLLSYGKIGTEGNEAIIKEGKGNKKTTIKETVLIDNLPHEYLCKYECNGMFKYEENYFEIIDDHNTHWVVVSEYKFKGLGAKLVGFFYPSSFKKRTKTYMTDFKNYLEKGISVAS